MVAVWWRSTEGKWIITVHHEVGLDKDPPVCKDRPAAQEGSLLTTGGERRGDAVGAGLLVEARVELMSEDKLPLWGGHTT